jgi:hypothetical protein
VNRLVKHISQHSKKPSRGEALNRYDKALTNSEATQLAAVAGVLESHGCDGREFIETAR